MSDVKQLFHDARRAGVPIIAIQTPDAAMTIRTLTKEIDANVKEVATPVLQWDFLRGYCPINAEGEEVQGQLEDQAENNPAGMTQQMMKMPRNCVVFVHNAQMFFGEPGFEQGISNLRDPNSGAMRSIVLLGAQMRLPATLANDIVFIDEAFPDSDQIGAIVSSVYERALEHDMPEDQLTKAVNALAGLPAFQCEQLTAMSMTRDGVVLDDLWERKRQQIEMTPGLTVHREGQRFSDIGGVAAVKDMFMKLVNSKRGFNCVVWIDEIDKMMGGQGDLSGVNQDQLGVILQYMENIKARGVLLAGPPGTSKSLLAKALGNEAGVPTVNCDFGAMKGSLMGQSEGQIRQAFKVIDSISNKKPLFVATCNRIDGLDTALLRRFPLTYIVDMPNEDEKSAIWKIHLDAYGLPAKSKLPATKDWAGADIHNCVEFASDLGLTPVQCAQFIVPVGERCASQIASLRKQADGTLLSASYPGPFRLAKKKADDSGGRQMRA